MISNKIVNFMMIFKLFKKILLIFTILFSLTSCDALKYKPVSAKDYPPEPEKRVAKNIEEGRGFRLMGGDKKGGTFDFASSNELWRASLDTIDFMPLASANYSGGIIITDWYSDETNSNESIKITIRFLTNEIRSDALDIKIFKKDCDANQNCSMYEEQGEINLEIKKSILKKAALYEKEKKKNIKKYKGPTFEGKGTDGGKLF